MGSAAEERTEGTSRGAPVWQGRRRDWKIRLDFQFQPHARLTAQIVAGQQLALESDFRMAHLHHASEAVVPIDPGLANQLVHARQVQHQTAEHPCLLLTTAVLTADQFSQIGTPMLRILSAPRRGLCLASPPHG